MFANIAEKLGSKSLNIFTILNYINITALIIIIFEKECLLIAGTL
jgi:hypothetical protein